VCVPCWDVESELAGVVLWRCEKTRVGVRARVRGRVRCEGTSRYCILCRYASDRSYGQTADVLRHGTRAEQRVV
jgi:hypothetical protein